VSPEAVPPEALSRQIDVDASGLRQGLPRSPMPQGAASIAALVDSLPRTDAPALIERTGVLSYAELAARISAATARLSAHGIRAGTIVAGCGINCSALAIAFFSVQRLGGVWVGINPALGAEEKSAQLRDCGVRFVLVGQARHDELSAICASLPEHPTLLVLEEEERQFVDMARPGPSARIGQSALPFPLPDAHAPAVIGYTSGTTGAAKGVVHSQHSLMGFVNGCMALKTSQWIPGARRGISISITIMNLMVYGPVLALAAGGCVVLMDRIDAAGVGQWIQDHRVEVFNGTPTTFWDLLCKPELQHLDLSSLKAVCLGGGPAPADLIEVFRNRFGYELRADYGLSEAPASVVLGTFDRGDSTMVYDLPSAHLRLAVLDAEGRPAAPGQIGELCIGPHETGEWAGVFTGMLGYWHRTAETRSAFHGDWLRTGDQVTIDAAGRMRIVGRQKEMILRGGANIYPAEVEAILRRHESIEEAVVLGIPDTRLGELVAAFVKLAPGTSTADLAARLKDFCQARIARYKVPERWYVIDEIPRNALNKPLRASIRTMTERALG
jgi:long-chain acyl-CoA synthetase